MVDLVKAILSREGVFLFDKASAPLDPVREAFVLTELVELIDDARAAQEWGIEQIEAHTPESWEQMDTREFAVDKRLLDECRAA